MSDPLGVDSGLAMRHWLPGVSSCVKWGEDTSLVGFEAEGHLLLKTLFPLGLCDPVHAFVSPSSPSRHVLTSVLTSSQQS